MGPMVSWLTIGLSAADGGTRLELVHESPVDPEFAAMYGPGAVGVGWDLALMGLGLHLEDSTPVDPAEFETFTFSPGGIALVEHRAEEHTSELQSLIRHSDAVFCCKKQ